MTAPVVPVIYEGDVLDVLATLADESAQCVITSPPYWGLRDYGVDGQLGLEKTPEEYVAKMAEVFREVKRVLRQDGTLWLNLGDSYCGGGNYRGCDESTLTEKQRSNRGAHGELAIGRTGSPPPTLRIPGLKPKDLVGIPWRFAFALQADGWWLRQDIIWSKPNPMPESVTDRCTKAHEYLFLLTKSARYFYDAEAVKEPLQGWVHAPGNNDPGKIQGTVEHQGGNSQFRDSRTREWGSNSGRNRRSVWHIPTQPYKGAHFATFPEKLVEPCILAGTSERGACSRCGAPWGRVVERGLTAHDGNTATDYSKGSTANRMALLRQAARERGEEYRNEARTVGWQPTCTCAAPTKPCLVLDPFCGSGTVGAVALHHKREFIGIELNPTYVGLAEARIQKGMRNNGK